MMGTYLSFYFYFFLKAKTQISALVEFTESFLQYLATQWMWVYNNERPHSSIGGIPPRRLLEAI